MQRGELVEVRGDEPDEPEADEAGTEGEDDARQGDLADLDVPAADRRRGFEHPRFVGQFRIGHIVNSPLGLGV